MFPTVANLTGLAYPLTLEKDSGEEAETLVAAGKTCLRRTKGEATPHAFVYVFKPQN